VPGPSGLFATAVTRPLFEGIGPLGKLTFYFLAALSTAVFGFGSWQRVRKYKLGRPAGRSAVVRSALRSRLHAIAAGTTVARRSRATGIAHFFILWGFLVAFLATVILTVDTDLVRNLSRLFAGHEDSFFHGTFFIVYSFAVDTMGFAFLVALVYMAIRRGLRRPARLDYSRNDQSAASYSRKAMVEGDWVFLGLLGAILVTAYVLTGLRILGQHMAWFTAFTPFARTVAEALSGLGMTAAAAVSAHGVVWWVHVVLALCFVAYLPYSKAMHVMLDGVNLVASDRTATLQLPAPPPGRAGYAEIGDFTWKELLDLDACTRCGRCHEVCPARHSGSPLSPREVILDLRQWVDTSSGGRTLFDRERRRSPTGPLAPPAGTKIAGGVIDAAALWSCTTCMHCVDVCPVGIEHVPTIVQLRRSLVDAADMGTGLQQALQNLATQGNSFGKSSRQRARWTRDLPFEITDARKSHVRYLWFVGDFASFDERLADSSRVLATLLHEAGVNFGLLYEAERDTGNDVRRVGEEGLFELLAAHNLEALAGASFDEIFTTDPHSLNALRNEYPALGASYRVSHHTELLARLLEHGEMAVRPLGYRVTYHDPCYLARYNGVVEAPRAILRALGCELVEMARSGVDTFCCGAGGGRIWMEDTHAGERPSEIRIKEALETGGDHFVVSCPKDFVMFSDAVKATRADDRIVVSDIVSLLAEGLDRQTVA
jgi:Fe-S oxidoreductase/nitrate reductase gamma subunit